MSEFVTRTQEPELVHRPRTPGDDTDPRAEVPVETGALRLDLGILRQGYVSRSTAGVPSEDVGTG